MVRERPVAALEVGTSKVLAAVAQPSSDGWRLLGVGVVPARGIRRGLVVDMDEAAAAIAAAAQRAQRAAGERLPSVLLGFGGGQVASRNAGASLDLEPSSEIGRGEVDRLLGQARQVEIPAGHDLVHVIPRHFTLDGLDGVRDPRGLSAATLAVDAHLVSCHATALQNAWRAVTRAGLEVGDLALNALAAAEAVLLPDERELGVALVDLGAGSTDVVVYRGGAPVLTASLPYGGDAVTADVAVGLRTSLLQAEELKRRHGTADPQLADPGTVLTVPGVAGGPGREVAEVEVAEMVAARVEEILEAAAALVAEAAPPDGLPGGVVLTGGMAETRGLLSAAMRAFGGPARVGSAAAQPLQGPALAAAAGLLQFAADRAAERTPARPGLWERLRGRG
jgi:cell division protein FtsA